MCTPAHSLAYSGLVLHVLRHPQFRKLYTAQVVALIGTGLLTVALGLLAYQVAGAQAGAVLGTALAIKMVAYVAVAPVVSAFTLRLPRRLVLVSADALRAGIALMLPFVTHTWQIYVLIALLQSASATFTPAFQSLIPSILTEERDYTHGLSLSRLAYDMESLLSPILAAVLLTVISYHSLFVGTAAGFVASALLVVTTRLPRTTAPERSAPLLERITEGARIMLNRPVLRGLLALNLAVAAATALVIVNTVVYVRDRLDGSNVGVALALGCFGFGSMVVALVTPRLLTAIPDRRLHADRRLAAAARPARRGDRAAAGPRHGRDDPRRDLGAAGCGHLPDQYPVRAPAARRVRTAHPHSGFHRAVLALARLFPAHLSDRGQGRRVGRPADQRDRAGRARYTGCYDGRPGVARERRDGHRGGVSGRKVTR